ncbi:MAG: hypothetical protein J4451_00070 [DPANN group archaeon]|nr:hypothetical protein [DPANN group archaeon]
MITYEQRKDYIIAKEKFRYGNVAAAAYAGITPQQATEIAKQEGFPIANRHTDFMYLTDEEISSMFDEHTPHEISKLLGVTANHARETSQLARIATHPIPENLKKFLDPKASIEDLEKKLKEGENNDF